ncbi:MAG: 30S ribosomal protein S1 [Oscillospiraceae bacterium]|nr:30S ribosomal protein S1 [Oscillospiraceae bacterium]
MSEILEGNSVELENTALETADTEEVKTEQSKSNDDVAISEEEAPCESAEAVEEVSGEVPVEAEPDSDNAEVSAETKPDGEMEFTEALEESLKSMSTDQKVKGVVMGITPSEIQVDIGRKHAGFVPVDEYSDDPLANPAADLKIGDELDLIIMKTNDAEGTVMLSKKRFDAAKAWIDVMEGETDGKIFEGLVTDVVRGGVLVTANGVRVFIPASLATESRNQPLEELLKKKIKFRIIEVNKQRKRAVGSARAVIREERRAKTEEFWAQAQTGQVYQGTVKSLTAYGAFVDIGGVDGMVHISEISWKRIKHPSEALKVGDEIEVYIKALDDEKKKISLGYKRAEDNPWEILRRDCPVGTATEAEVVGMTAFGAFATVMPGIDGLIHISQIANRHIEKPQDALRVGDKVMVKVTDIDFEKKRVSLSIRALLDPMEKGEEEAVEEAAPVIEEESPAAVEEASETEE